VERLDEQTDLLHRIEAAAGGEPMDENGDDAGRAPQPAARP
jgi:hypothetical protein